MENKTSSPRKLASAHANGALSRGPVTPEGKQRSAANSLKHGLCARSMVMPGESRETFQEIRDLYYAQFRPRTLYESNLVDNLIASYWRQSRALLMESAAYALQIGEQRPKVDKDFQYAAPAIRAVLALRGDLHADGAIVTCSRYSLRFERQWSRTLDKLLALLRQPPVGPTLDELDSIFEEEAIVQNEPNPISGQSANMQSRSTIGVDPCSSVANSTVPIATQ